MSEGYVRKVRLCDIAPLAADLRQADVAEIKAASGKTPEAALYASLTLGGETRVICLNDGTPVGIFGVVPIAKDLGGIWMVATNQFQLLHRQFLRECHQGIDDLCKGYKVVFNCTDARNKVHHRWIKWAGFSIIKRHTSYGYEGREFLEFAKITGGRHV